MSWRERRRLENDQAREWHGGYRSYDLVKEFVIALGVVLGVALVLTILFSSPDDPPSTIKSWSRSDPVDFVTTAVSQLDGTSETATYGP
ncbi:MAG: cytochrome B6, partial [Solirubrobacteraceae bacterium]